MPRLAVPYIPRVVGTAQPVGTAPPPGDNYSDRLVKYLPAESIAFYTATDKLFGAFYGLDSTGTASRAPDIWFSILPSALFILGVVGTFVYLYARKLRGQPWMVNVFVGTIAFALWAYTLDGSLFRIHHWYSDFAAALMAPTFTFAVAAISPR
jgi:hypothetical protein